MTPFQIALTLCVIGFAVFGIAMVFRAKQSELATPKNRLIFTVGLVASVLCFALLSAFQ